MSRLNRPIPIEKRFFNKIDMSGDCWIWTGAKCNGYGIIRLGNKQVKAHRIAYKLEYGELPEYNVDNPKLLIRHKCDNTLCVKPDHLEIGTPKQNSQDMVSRGRSLAGNKNPGFIHKDKLPRGDNHPWTKLTEKDRQKICYYYFIEDKSSKEIAKIYGVVQETIQIVLNNFQPRKSGNPKLTDRKVKNIRRFIKEGKSVVWLAEKYNVSKSTIRNVQNNKFYKF